MSEEIFSRGERIWQNFNGIIEKQYRLTELRICELAGLARSMLEFASRMQQNELLLYEILPLISEELNASAYTHNQPSMNLPENTARLEYAARVTENLDRAVLAQLFCERADTLGVQVSEADILSSEPIPPTFVYVKNAYSDEAYDVLTEDMKDARVKYVNSFKEAAMAISDGVASYCILPLEEHSVRIASVSELIAAYDLKINSITSVLGFDGTADMKYAMLSHSYSVPSRDEGDDRYLEIRHFADSEYELSDIIFAASSYGHRIYRLNTCRVIEDGEPKMYYSLVLRDDDGDFSAMLVYLSLFSPESVVVGMYKNLE